MVEPETSVEPSALIVVRAGAVDRFAALRAAFGPDGVDVVWELLKRPVLPSPSE